jgi:phage gpG-like protein
MCKQTHSSPFILVMIQKNKFHFHEKLQQLKGSFKQKVTTQVAQHILIFFKGNFVKGGTEKDGFVKWKERKFKVNRKLLVDTGMMKNSMKLTSKTFEKIRIEVSAPHATYHQHGTEHIPQREMLYDSKVLNKELDNIIKKEIDKLFKK